jgi:hypothetical protein
MDLCDFKHTLRALFFPRDRDITLQANRILVLGDGTIVSSSSQVSVGCIVLWSGAIGAIPSGYQICDGTNGTPDLRDRFVVGAGSTYAVDDTGGSATKDVSHDHGVGTLAAANESAHTHGPGSLGTDTAANHTHTGGTFVTNNDNHSHSVTTGSSAAEAAHTHGDGSYATDSDGHSHTMPGASVVIGTEPHHYHADGSYTAAAPAAGTGHLMSYGATVNLISKATFDAHAHDVTGISGDAGSHTHTITGSTNTHNHSHNVNAGSSGAGSSHSHGPGSYGTDSYGHTHGSFTGTTGSDGAHSHSVTTGNSAAGSAHTHTLSGTTASGGSASQDILPPYYALAYIMRIS